jgi:diaminohydroxyphosphoribosylaminopyrimidine deaminase / 5-amino-6-(5-phosphoribosylamino)uracil reductase
MLDVRLVEATRQPHLVIVDSRLETPTGARLFRPAAGGLRRKIFIYAAVSLPERRAELEALGATVIEMPGPDGKVDLAAMLLDLGRLEVNELHVEAGHKLNGSFLREGLVDELLLYLAPQLLGSGAMGLSAWGPLQSLDQKLALRFGPVTAVGDDLRILARVEGRDAFLDL